MRSCLVTREVDLLSLECVQPNSGLPYPDCATYHFGLHEGIALRDKSGATLSTGLQKSSPWRDTSGVAAAIIYAVSVTDVRCSPRCWEMLHDIAGLPTPPFPEQMTRPSDESWGEPVRTSRRTRTAFAVAQWCFATAPVAGSFAVSLIIGFEHPMMALTSLAGGLSVSGPAAAYLLAYRRRSDNAFTSISRDGRATQRAHLGGPSQLRLRVAESVANLTRLANVTFEPATKLNPTYGTPAWWRMFVADADGNNLVFELMHEHEPPAVLFPQLCHFVEASGIALGEDAHHGLSLRLGRELTNPKATADA